MIDLNKPFTLLNSKPRNTFQLANTLNGIKCYRSSDNSTYIVDILSKRGATVYISRGNIFVDGQEFTPSPRPSVYSYGIQVQDQFQYSNFPSDQEVITPSNHLNVSVPIIALKGTGNISVDAIAGPYLVDYDNRRYYPAAMEDTFRYKTFQLVPAVSSQLLTSKKIQESTDLDIAPETPPKNNLLSNLFTNIKSGTRKDAYVKDDDHQIIITLTHTSSHG